MKLRLDPRLRELLDSSGFEWRLEAGGKHWKIFLGPRLATCLPKGTGYFHMGNVLSQVRRTIKELQQP